MSGSVLAWHFSNGRLGYGDGRRIAAGLSHHIEGPLVMCQHGLHGSIRALDALSYAPPVSPLYLARVELSGTVIRGTDKCVASDRTYLWVQPVDMLLHEFACECAECALMIAQEEDERCWRAIAVKREWMAGRATDRQLAVARDAARAAARAVARAAARDAARDAARAAAWDASWLAAKGTAWAAAGDLFEYLIMRYLAPGAEEQP